MVRIDADTESPYEVLWLDNGIVRLGLVPALGGRLLSVHFGALELLWRNDSLLDDRLWARAPVAPTSGSMGDWINYGGDKTWPAPQGWSSTAEWAGPPDPVLDSGRYTSTVDERPGRVVVTLVSGDDPRTGLRLTRTFTLRDGECGYRLDLTATNVSSREVRWSLWNVTQLPGGGDVHIGLMPGFATPVIPLVAGTGTPEFRLTADRAVVSDQDVVGKLGFPGSAGWVSYAGPAGTLTQRFTVDPAAEYPDGGSPVEVWLEHPLPQPLAGLGGLDPPARIVECEVLGPLAPLTPGTSTSLTIDVTIT